MFCFITSIRAPQLSNDWLRVCELFERTTASVFNQTVRDFRLIAVCHEPPILKRKFDERLEFIRVDFPLPRQDFDSMTLSDKVPKLLVAMRRARELNADFVMPLDADDLVSRSLAEHALAHFESDGWFVDRGWRYEYGRQFLETVDSFNHICGSCNVLARRWFVFPNDVEKERLADAALIEKGHNKAVELFAELGATLRPFPFRAAVYTVRNGENTSNTLLHETRKTHRNLPRRLAGQTLLKLRTWLHRRPCGAGVQREFALNTSVP